MELNLLGQKLSVADLAVIAGFVICIITLLFGGAWMTDFSFSRAYFSGSLAMGSPTDSETPGWFMLPTSVALLAIYSILSKPKLRFFLPALGALAGLLFSWLVFSLSSRNFTRNLSIYIFFAGSLIILLGSLWGIKTEFLSKKK